MSQDEEDAIVGRMIREQRQLEKSRTVLNEEIHRIGEGLQRLGQTLIDINRQLQGTKTLSEAEQSLLDPAKIQALLNEWGTVNERLNQLRDSLSKL
jgi:DNA repair ATPase RecN